MHRARAETPEKTRKRCGGWDAGRRRRCCSAAVAARDPWLRKGGLGWRGISYTRGNFRGDFDRRHQAPGTSNLGGPEVYVIMLAHIAAASGGVRSPIRPVKKGSFLSGPFSGLGQGGPEQPPQKWLRSFGIQSWCHFFPTSDRCFESQPAPVTVFHRAQGLPGVLQGARKSCTHSCRLSSFSSFLSPCFLVCWRWLPWPRRQAGAAQWTLPGQPHM